ncbi:MAG: GNAT family N-acetyltransferase [Curvibacter sp.]|nr:GNAT family N-acetyltransferase [Curvibacter sp.]
MSRSHAAPAGRQAPDDVFLYTRADDPLAQPLVEALTQEYDSRYGDFFREPGVPPEMQRYPAEAFLAPEGNFLLLLRQGQAVGGGAFKRHDGQTAEFKRIWTREDLRRQGLARRVLVELEAQAWRQGYRRIYLTTGCRQPEAVALYLGWGYRALYDPRIDPEIHRTLPFEKKLRPPTPVALASVRSGPQAAVGSNA